jgi:hypothetical protein
MSDGTHDNCTITVTDNASNTSNPLDVTDFTIGAVNPLWPRSHRYPLIPMTTPQLHLLFDVVGDINYGVPGSCSSDNDTAVVMIIIL